MNTRKSEAKFKNFRILLEIGFSSTIVMGRLAGELSVKKYAPMQWHTKEGNITANIKGKVDLTLPALSSKNVVTWKYHVDDSDKGRYNMILGRDL